MGKRQIVADGEVRKELKVLKNHPHVCSQLRKVRVGVSDIDVVYVDSAFLIVL